MLFSAHSPSTAREARVKPRKWLRRRDPAEEDLVALVGDDPEKAGGEGGQAGGEPVHAVEEVHGAGDADDPEDGQEHVEGLSPERPGGEEGERDPGVDDEQRRQHEDGELERGGQGARVVDEAHEHHAGRRDQEPEHRRGEDGVGEQAHQEGQVDGDPPEERGRLAVELAAVGHVEDPVRPGQRADRTDQEEREQEREEQDVEPAAARLGEPPLQGEEEEQQDGEDRRQVEEAPPRGRDGLRHRDGLVHRPAASTAAAATRSTSSAPRDG